MTKDLRVERLTEYSPGDAADLGSLLTALSGRFTGEPVPESLLREIIESPYHDELVARLEGRIVGAATLSIIMGAGAGKKGYLEDFVVDKSIRRGGIGTRIWQEMMLWCEERGVDLEFTSRPERQDAHEFYASRGAKIRPTSVFRVQLMDE
ncbi:MAG TPA: GNAT family N-acetyltransferase [Candidatus Saccharimonadales bacterium]|nr:GNAT family N-acetyltransferase [Candidatus Saccharimonadales bacterium]